MRIVVLVKPVPDPASGAERLGPDGRLERAAAPAVVNGNDEYALEAALKLIEAHGGEVTLVSMAPANAPETMRKALAMGAANGVHVTDPALEGSDTVSTARVLAAALEGLEFDLVLAGVDTSDGVSGVVPAGVAALRRLPYLSYAAKIEPDPGAGTVRVHRISPTGFDVLEAPMPALISCTQALGEPRYPSLKGIMAARSRTIDTRAIDDLGVDGATVGGAVTTTAVVDSRPPVARAATRVVREAPEEAARQLVAFLAERRLVGGRPLMGGIYVIGEVTADGHLANISAEVATLARNVAAQGGQEVSGIVVAADPQAAAEELARYLPRVLTVTEPAAADRPWSMVAAERIAHIVGDDVREFEFVGAGPDGRDFAGALSALTGWGVLGNAVAVTWADGSPVVEMSVFGGKLTTTSRFTTDAGIVTVRPNVVTAQPADTAGTVEAYVSEESLEQPPVKVVERISEASAALPIEEAKIIVAGGRGVGGAEGFALVEELAEAMGGVVGATRAAVDSGWIPYSQQIGQTGKIVKPQLYFALGISGAIQHKVGMQTAGTIVAVNRDPDAPIAEFADMVVVGDLFEVGRAVLGELRARSG